MTVATLGLYLAEESFVARLRWELAPRSCARLLALLPYTGEVVHTRWSGEAIWSPLGCAWPRESYLLQENATQRPDPGEILLYAGELSEPELLIPYGTCRFASRAGPIEGKPVLLIEERSMRLAGLGADILRRGAMKLSVSNSKCL